MKYEYLLFNFLVAAGPVAFSFEDKVRFFRKWPQALQAILIVMVPYIVWDSLVTGHHWRFNESLITGMHIANLPIEEILFFLTVPFACLFVWEVFFTSQKSEAVLPSQYLWVAGFVSFFASVAFFIAGNVYTALIFLALILVMVMDVLLDVGIVRQKRSIRFLGVVTLFILIFNGYLTARPVVLYDESYMLGFRIFTIPVEDFFYGYTLVFLTLIFYEKFRRMRHG